MPAVCLVDRENITTYDGLHYNATFGECDHLITKDCSGRYKMAVLARHENDKKVRSRCCRCCCCCYYCYYYYYYY